MDTIIHLGAGHCRELPHHLAKTPARLILVEANPRLARRLRRRTEHLAPVVVEALAIAGASAPCELRIFNHTEASSLREPTQLRKLFPGLRCTETLPVDVRAAADWVARLELSPQHAHQLVIDTPGEEHAIVQSLAQAERLRTFETVTLICGHQPLYADSESAESVLAALKDQGFFVNGYNGAADPDRPTWHLKRDPSFVELRQARARIHALEAALAEQQRLVKQRESALEQEQKAHALAQRRIGELESEAAEHERERNALTAARERIHALEAERDEAGQRYAIIDQQLQKAEGQIDLLKQLLLQPPGEPQQQHATESTRTDTA